MLGPGQSPPGLAVFLLDMCTGSALRKVQSIELDDGTLFAKEKSLPVFLNNFGIILRSIWH